MRQEHKKLGRDTKSDPKSVRGMPKVMGEAPKSEGETQKVTLNVREGHKK